MSLPQGNPQGIWLSSKAKDGEFEPCLGVNEFEPELSSLFLAEHMCFFLLMWRCLKL